jgi:RimJ/RimL family protein N-acetyltransferase
MFARTQRLLLRPGWADDAPALVRAIGNEKIVRNLAQLPWPYARGDAESFLETAHGKGAPEFLIFARTQAEPALVGGIGLHVDPDGEADRPELGYWIAEPHWGKGYATEAAHAVVNIARHTLKLPGLRSAHFLDNPASGKVLCKAGFRPTGKVVQRRSNGRRADVPTRLFALEFEEAGEVSPTSMRCAPVLQLAA